MNSERLNFIVRLLIAFVLVFFLFRFTKSNVSEGDALSAFFVLALWLLYGFVLFLVFGTSFISKVADRFGNLYMPSDSGFRIVPEYSLAEAHVKKGRYTEAIDEYRKVITEHPADVYAHVRIAELATEHLHDLKLAETELLAAQAKAVQEDAMALTAHRLADLYQHQLNSPQRGLDVLLSVRGRLTSAKRLRLMEERIEFLRQLVEGHQMPQPPKSIQLRKSRYRMHD